MKQAQKPIKNYDCTQAELYAICRIGWTNCRNLLARFTQFKTFYTSIYIDDREAEITYAESLPDSQQRGEAAEIAHNQLKEKADQCLIAWQTLKAYILDAFDKNTVKPKLEAAGSKLYFKASKHDWESITKLMEQTATFINDNNNPLTTKGGMPPTFQAEQDNLKDDFNTLYSTFQTEQQNAETLTTTKINANNLIYAQLMKMFTDGKKIFRLERAFQEQFIWDQILELVSGTSGGNGGTPPTTETIVIATKQNPPVPFSMEFMGTIGEKITIEWSDGTSDTITMDGTFVSISHTYSAIGNYTISITGAKAAFTEMQALNGQHSSINLPDTINLRGLTLNDNQFSSLFIPATYTDMLALSAANNDIDQQSINLILTTINDFGTSNGVIYLNGGNNQSPSGQGIAAMNQLIARGWTVVTN